MAVFVPGVGSVALKQLIPGAVAVAIGAVIIRPVLRTSIRAGYGVMNLGRNVMAEAKAEIERAKVAARSNPVEAELKQLREEVAQLRAQAAKRA